MDFTFYLDEDINISLRLVYPEMYPIIIKVLHEFLNPDLDHIEVSAYIM